MFIVWKVQPSEGEMSGAWMKEIYVSQKPKSLSNQSRQLKYETLFYVLQTLFKILSTILCNEEEQS